MNFDKLRKRIVEQAIRGQLVPQVRGEHFLSPGPYEIPQTWRWVRLAEIATNIEYGTSVKCHDLPGEQDIPVIRMGNIQNGKLNFQKLKFAPRNSVDLPKLILEDGDIVFNRTNSRELVGKCAVFFGGGKEFSFASYIIRARVHEQEPVYISEYINSDLCRSTQILPFVTQQVGQANFNGTKLKNILIPLPPLEEQARIVEKLKEVFAEIDRAEKAYQELQTLSSVLRGQILQEAIQGKLVPQLDSEEEVQQIGDAPEDVPFAIPEKWKWFTLGSVIEYGKCNQLAGNEISSETWVLDLEDIEKNTGRILDKKRGVSTTSNKNKFEEGFVLYSKLRPYLNKVVIADESGVCTTEIVPIDVASAKVPLLARYLQCYLMSPLFLNHANQASYGVKMPRLGTKDARSALIPIPPIEEQKRIVDKIEDLLKQVDALSGR